MIGEILLQPDLRFNYASTYAKDKSPKRGLRRFGPYDLEHLQKDVIKCIIFYPNGREDVKEVLIKGLIDGEGYFDGFRSLFRVPIEFIDELSYSEDDFETLIEDVISKHHNIDLVYFLLERRKLEIYKRSKFLLVSSGIPSQMICIKYFIKYSRASIYLGKYSISKLCKNWRHSLDNIN